MMHPSCAKTAGLNDEVPGEHQSGKIEFVHHNAASGFRWLARTIGPTISRWGLSTSRDGDAHIH